MATSKIDKTSSTPESTVGGGHRGHAAAGDQPTRTRATAAGTAKPADAPSVGDALVVPVAMPSRDLLREVDLVISRGTEVTIVQGKTSVKVTGETLAAMRQIIAALSAGPLSLLLGDTRDTELTSQEVADLLNVSRPYVVKLAREGRIAHKLVGNRHRFLLSDVRAYEQGQRLTREQALASLVPEDGYSDEDF